MSRPSLAFSALERRSVVGLAAIFAARMLGLFMILPIFSLYARSLPGATPTLAGLAIGIYGLTQSILQLPFGMWSDRVGRKPIITLGLSIFCLGSILAACSNSIYGIILGRALQGAGAVGSTIIATIGDVTRLETRTKAMAIVGMTIGGSFGLAMVLGPLLSHWLPISGIFALTAVLALCGLIILHGWIPPLPPQSSKQSVLSHLRLVLCHRDLLRLDAGVFIQHATLTAAFIALPIILKDTFGFSSQQQGYLYFALLTFTFALTMPLIRLSEKQRRVRAVFLSCILLLGLSLLGITQIHHSIILLAGCLFIFFLAFNFLEANLPSLVSKTAPSTCSGTATGVYSSSQFLGLFCGGLAGGVIYGHYSLSGVLIFCWLLSLVWFVIAYGMAEPENKAKTL